MLQNAKDLVFILWLWKHNESKKLAPTQILFCWKRRPVKESICYRIPIYSPRISYVLHALRSSWQCICKWEHNWKQNCLLGSLGKNVKNINKYGCGKRPVTLIPTTALSKFPLFLTALVVKASLLHTGYQKWQKIPKPRGSGEMGHK